MARTYAVVEIDKEVTPMGWEVVLSASEGLHIARKLRKGGFYGGFATIEELKADCLRLSPPPSTSPGLATYDDPSLAIKKHSLTASPSVSYQNSEDFKASAILVTPSRVSAEIVLQSQFGCTQIMKEALEQSPLKAGSQQRPNLKNHTLKVEHEMSPILEESLMQVNPFIGGTKQVRNRASGSSIGSLSTQRNNVSQVYAKEETGMSLNENNNGDEGRADFHETGSESDCKRRQATGNLISDMQNKGSMHPRGSDSSKSDIDSDGSPICFKRPRKGTAIEERMSLQRSELAVDNCGLLSTLNLSKKHIMAARSIDDRDKDADDSNIQISPKKLSIQPLSDSEPDSEPLILKRSNSGRRKIQTPGIIEQENLHDDSDVDCATLRSRMQKVIAQRRNRFRVGDEAACLETDVSSIVQRSNEIACLDKDGKGVRQQESILAAQATNKLDKASGACEPSIKSDNSLQICDRARGLCTVNEEGLKQRLNELIWESHQNTQYQHNLFERKCTPPPLAALAKLNTLAYVGKKALRCLESGGSSVDAEAIFPRKYLRDFEMYKDELDGYAVDRYLPSSNKQKEVAERMNCYIDDGDTLLEVSGWANDFFSFLRERLSKSGKKFDYKKLLLSSLNRAGSLKEWFVEEKEVPSGLNLTQDTGAGGHARTHAPTMSTNIHGSLGEWFIEGKGLPTGSNLIICFSPAFELKGQQQVREFLGITLQRKPKLICSIVPSILSQRLEEMRNYELIWEDQKVLKGEGLWPWGLMNIPETAIDSKSGISPSMYMWSRSDWATKHRQVALHFGHIPKQGREAVQSPRLQSKMISPETEHVKCRVEKGTFYDSSQQDDFQRTLLADNFSNTSIQGDPEYVGSSYLQYDETMKDPNEYHSNCGKELHYKSNVLDTRWFMVCCDML